MGIRLSHAYTLIDLFKLYNEDGSVYSHMLMIRDPYGPEPGRKVKDQYSPLHKGGNLWTDHFKSQVPGGIDPTDVDYFNKTGIFFMNIYTASRAFDGITTTEYREEEGYSNSWYDVDNDEPFGKKRNFTFEIPKLDGDVYVSVESYSHKMVDPSCQ